MKRIITGLVIISLALIATSCGNRKKSDKDNTTMTENMTRLPNTETTS